MDAKVGTGRGRKRLKTAVIVALIIVLGAGAGVAARWWQTRNSADSDYTPTPALPETVTELQDRRVEGDEVAFNTELEKALNDPRTTSETRYLLYVQQGHAAYDKGDWQAAISAYVKAEEIESTYEIAELLAETYRAAGDTAKAIEYYEKAKTLISPDNPRGQALKDLLDKYINDLKSGNTGSEEQPQ